MVLKSRQQVEEEEQMAGANEQDLVGMDAIYKAFEEDPNFKIEEEEEDSGEGEDEEREEAERAEKLRLEIMGMGLGDQALKEGEKGQAVDNDNL